MNTEYFKNLGRTEEGYAEIQHTSGSVFLIGDSICMGYQPFVKENLQKKYDVVYPNENCRNSQYIITSLNRWVHEFKEPQDVKLVSFNCGHWDVAHWNRDDDSLTSVAEYQKNIKRIIRQLKKVFPKAIILFFTTSPMSPNPNINHINYRSNKEIEVYNEAAVLEAIGENVYVADMYEFMKDWDETNFIDYVHLTMDANRVLGKFVTKKILSLLEG
ncbi:MAG: SGNH/GDSL hydrolase family protein [Ruminococcaceae bacterium]|nr:SGNH/GDSL hydrolase family protein [Oscillospiraceae bacterium]MBE6811237.1 SGNH/GDSL hydrolase family protein [Oscillospiraceae bacterium]